MNYHIKAENWKHIFNILSKRKDIRIGNESKLRIFIEAIWFIVNCIGLGDLKEVY